MPSTTAITAALGARSVVVEQASDPPLYWRVRRLSVAEVVRITGPEALVPLPDTSPEHEEALRQAREAERGSGVLEAAEQAEALACAAVDAVSVDRETWEPVQIVTRDERPEEGRLLVSTLQTSALEEVVIAALGGMAAGREEIAPFRPAGSAGSAGPGTVEAGREAV